MSRNIVSCCLTTSICGRDNSDSDFIAILLLAVTCVDVTTTLSHRTMLK